MLSFDEYITPDSIDKLLMKIDVKIFIRLLLHQDIASILHIVI